MICFSYIQNRFNFFLFHNILMNWSIFQVYILEYHSKFIDHHMFGLSKILRGSYDKILLFKLMDVESEVPHLKNVLSIFVFFSVKKKLQTTKPSVQCNTYVFVYELFA